MSKKPKQHAKDEYYKGTTKKKTYKQLEKHIANTKILLLKVTTEMVTQKKTVEGLEAQLTCAKAYIGYLTKDRVEIEKEDIAKCLETKAVTWKEEDTKIIISVIEKEIVKEDQVELCNNCINKGETNCKLGKSYTPDSCLSYCFVCCCGKTQFEPDETHCKDCGETLLI